MKQDINPVARKIRPFLWALGIIGLIEFFLYKLANMPYRPPQDMSTFLGGPELMFVWTLITILGLVWILLFVRSIFVCIRARRSDENIIDREMWS